MVVLTNHLRGGARVRDYHDWSGCRKAGFHAHGVDASGATVLLQNHAREADSVLCVAAALHGEMGPEEPGFSKVLAARLGDLDPVRELPYRLAALIIAASKAGQMAASDDRVRPIQKSLASKGASTDGKRTFDPRAFSTGLW